MKTGLVLEGGALRTIFSSGACDAMVEAGVMTDYVVGVSAGIAYGVSYVSRQPRRNLEILVKYANDKRYMGVRNLLNPFNRCYFGRDFAYNTIPNRLVPFDYDTFAAFPGAVEAAVTNLNTGRAEYLPVPRQDDGKFLVLQATCALPLMFPTIHIDGQPYLDGGIAAPIPHQRAFDQGCDRVLVFLTHERNYIRKPEPTEGLIQRRYRRYPNFCKLMRRRVELYNRCREELFRLEAEGKVMILTPLVTEGFSRVEKDVTRIRTLWEDGYHQAQVKMDQIRAFLGK